MTSIVVSLRESAYDFDQQITGMYDTVYIVYCTYTTVHYSIQYSKNLYTVQYSVVLILVYPSVMVLFQICQRSKKKKKIIIYTVGVL